jgi:phosphoribosylformimino-5-aminoimidazole carboxamide ribotide isomerase
MRFRPCIDLRNGRVVQIVGGTLSDNKTEETITNFETDQSSANFARLYQTDHLIGGHVIALGAGNELAAIQALQTHPKGLHMGGGITPVNAKTYLNAGASHVIVTSYVFRNGQLDKDRLQELVTTVGKEHLVLDLSCRKRNDHYLVVTDRWQKFTQLAVTEQTLSQLATSCDEFLVHGVDVEGKRTGIEEPLVEMLGQWSPIPVTYAGGAQSLADLDHVNTLGRGRVDLTIGSALNIFGGDVAYKDVVAWHKNQQQIRT